MSRKLFSGLLGLLLIGCTSCASPPPHAPAVVSLDIWTHCGILLGAQVIWDDGTAKYYPIRQLDQDKELSDEMQAAMKGLNPKFVHVMTDMTGCSET